MNKVICFASGTRCDNAVFLKAIWPKIHELIQDKAVDHIILDMNDVVFVSPLILPEFRIILILLFFFSYRKQTGIESKHSWTRRIKRNEDFGGRL